MGEYLSGKILNLKGQDVKSKSQYINGKRSEWQISKYKFARSKI